MGTVWKKCEKGYRLLNFLRLLGFFLCATIRNRHFDRSYLYLVVQVH